MEEREYNYSLGLRDSLISELQRIILTIYGYQEYPQHLQDIFDILDVDKVIRMNNAESLGLKVKSPKHHYFLAHYNNDKLIILDRCDLKDDRVVSRYYIKDDKIEFLYINGNKPIVCFFDDEGNSWISCSLSMKEKEIKIQRISLKSKDGTQTHVSFPQDE